MALNLAQASAPTRVSSASLAGAILSQAGGALVVRLADGRVIAVPGFFPHAQPPLPTELAATQPIVLTVDDYYAVVAGGDPADPGSTTPESLAEIAPAAGPDPSPPAPASALGAGDGPGPATFRSASSEGVASLIVGSFGGPVGAASGDFGGSSTSAVGDTGAGPAGGAADAGPQPPTLLAGLPLGGFTPASPPVIGTAGAGVGGAAPLGNVTSGNTGGGGSTLLSLVPAGAYTISVNALAGGYDVLRAGDPTPTLFRPPSVGVGIQIQDPANGSSVTIAGPSDWLLLRRDAFDNAVGQRLSTDAFGLIFAPFDTFEASVVTTIDQLPVPGLFDVAVVAAVAAGVTRYGIISSQYFNQAPLAADLLTIGDPQDPNFVVVRGIDEIADNPRPVTSLVSATNQWDFSGLDGAKFSNVDVFDAVNGVASSLTFDRATLDGMRQTLRFVDQGGTGPAAHFYAARGDAQDSVAFADPQNWLFDGVTAAGAFQYRAIGTTTPLFLEVDAAIGSRPAYNFAGTAADETLALPDSGFGALDGGGGTDLLRFATGSFDFTGLAAGRSVTGFEIVDAGADPAANLISIDESFVTGLGIAAPLTLIGDAADRAEIVGLETAWTQVLEFQAAPDGTTLDFVLYRALASGAQVAIQRELAQDLAIVRNGGAGDDVLTVEATAKRQTIDGGAGFDRLQPLTAGALDFTALAPGSTMRNIEAIDARGQGVNALTLDDVFVANAAVDRVLSVLGDAGDTLTIAGGWTRTGSFPVGGATFDRYQATASANLAVTLFVDSNLAVSAVP